MEPKCLLAGVCRAADRCRRLIVLAPARTSQCRQTRRDVALRCRVFDSSRTFRYRGEATLRRAALAGEVGDAVSVVRETQLTLG